MKCPNCNRPLKKLKGKHKFAVNIPSSDKIFKETLEEHDKHCGCNEVHTKEDWKIKDYLALVKAIRKDVIDEIFKEFDNLYAKKKLYLKEQQMPIEDWWGESEIFSVNELDKLRNKIAKEMKE